MSISSPFPKKTDPFRKRQPPARRSAQTAETQRIKQKTLGILPQGLSRNSMIIKPKGEPAWRAVENGPQISWGGSPEDLAPGSGKGVNESRDIGIWADFAYL